MHTDTKGLQMQPPHLFHAEPPPPKKKPRSNILEMGPSVFRWLRDHEKQYQVVYRQDQLAQQWSSHGPGAPSLLAGLWGLFFITRAWCWCACTEIKGMQLPASLLQTSSQAWQDGEGR